MGVCRFEGQAGEHMPADGEVSAQHVSLLLPILVLARSLAASVTRKIVIQVSKRFLRNLWGDITESVHLYLHPMVHSNCGVYPAFKEIVWLWEICSTILVKVEWKIDASIKMLSAAGQLSSASCLEQGESTSAHPSTFKAQFYRDTVMIHFLARNVWEETWPWWFWYTLVFAQKQPVIRVFFLNFYKQNVKLFLSECFRKQSWWKAAVSHNYRCLIPHLSFAAEILSNFVKQWPWRRSPDLWFSWMWLNCADV